ncbi:MAG TPA: hypothetical protein VFI40_14460, partial [Nocardioides sp.]|nr:hypothetical protein [Nocardioides sp.]
MRARSIAGWSAALLAATIVTVPSATASPAGDRTTGTTAATRTVTARTTGALGVGSGQAAARSGTKKVHRFQPDYGPTFNNPLGDGPTKYRALNVVQAAIQHARKKSIIRIMSWNIMSRSVVT